MSAYQPTANVRRMPLAALAKRIILPLIAVLVLLLLADRLYHPLQFQIKKVQVRGEYQNVDTAQVKAAAARAINGNFFALSLSQIEKEVTALPWVFSASLRRQWPATLVVEVVEVEPVARWGAQHWLHAGGGLVARQDQSSRDGLPELFASGDQHQMVWDVYQKWTPLFADAGLVIAELQLDVRDLWRMTLSSPTLKNEINLIAARADADARITEFATVLRRRLLEEVPVMKSVDLRYPNGFAVGWKAAR